MTAIYIRTAEAKDDSHWSRIWKLPDGISAEEEISRMTAYATEREYTDLIFYSEHSRRKELDAVRALLDVEEGL